MVTTLRFLIRSIPVSITALERSYLPIFANSKLPDDGTCSSTLNIGSNELDISSWYDIWQALVAVNGMCTRIGKIGYARALGKSPSLKIAFLGLGLFN